MVTAYFIEFTVCLRHYGELGYYPEIVPLEATDNEDAKAQFQAWCQEHPEKYQGNKFSTKPVLNRRTVETLAEME